MLAGTYGSGSPKYMESSTFSTLAWNFDVMGLGSQLEGFFAEGTKYYFVKWSGNEDQERGPTFRIYVQ